MIAWRIRCVDETASTNDDAKAAARQGEAEGLVIHALRQSAGRGRHGRIWQSPEGNLYASVLLRPPNLDEVAGFYSFAAALALADTVTHFAPQAVVTLKWPNDVLADGRKISGILLEREGDALVVGMGLNIEHYPADAAYPATSLKALLPLQGGEGFGMRGESGVRNPGNIQSGLFDEDISHTRPPPHPPIARAMGPSLSPLWGAREISNILTHLLTRLSHYDAIIRRSGFPPIRTAWLARALTGPLTVKLPAGPVAGDLVGLSDRGHLRLRLADGTERAIATGDVFPAL